MEATLSVCATRLLSLVTLLLATSLAACTDPAPDRIDQLTIPAPTLARATLDNPPQVPALVLLPPGYHTSDRYYPVIYYLPGFTTDVFEYIDGTFDGFHFGDSLDRTIHAGAGREIVVVIVHGRNALGGSFYVNSPVTGAWEDHLLVDVVPYVEARYRLLAEPACRGVAGESMGGTGAIHLAMRHADTFGAVFAISPGLFDGRGLEDHGMLAEPYRDAWIIQRRWMNDWPPEEAPTRLIGLARELYAASGMFGYRRAFLLAYGAAYAPAPEEGPPYVAFPWVETGDGWTLDPDRLARFRSGFGDLERKVEEHSAALRTLDAIGLDVGSNDPLEWLPRGVRRLSSLLESKGIPHDLTEHDGGHVDRLGERIETVMLPFFAQALCRGAARESPP